MKQQSGLQEFRTYTKDYRPAFTGEIQNKYPLLHVGELIRDARKKAELTQQELADKIGSKRSFISRIERDASSLRLNTLVDIVEKGLAGKVNVQIVI